MPAIPAPTKKQLIYAILGKVFPNYTLLEIYTPRKDQRVTFYKGKDGSVIVAFFGTMNRISDWINNFLIEFKNFVCGSKTYRGGSGWINETNDLLTKVKTMINTHCTNNIVYVTGHSQGGCHAMATCAHLMEVYPTKQIRGSSFNQPMLFNQASATLFQNTVASKSNTCSFDRWVVPGDPASLLPSQVFGFYHAMPTKKLENKIRFFPDIKYHQVEYILGIV